MTLAQPPRPPAQDPAKNIWDDSAEMYNQMAAMELSYTANQINCLDLSSEDTVLDIGCGPGRITRLVAPESSRSPPLILRQPCLIIAGKT